MKPKPQYAFIKSIDRSTRAGGDMMLFLYDMYHNEGIKLVDMYGILQDHSINTLQHTGFEYSWSIKNPARKLIYMEGERAREEVQDILTRMIDPEIRYVRFGYAVGEPPFGLKNIKMRTDHGLRSVWDIHTIESKWVIRIFELTVEGYTDEHIIKTINDMGYKSRIENHYDKNDKKKIRVIGYQGGKPLDQKQLDRIRQNPAYAGIMKHEWLKQNKDDIVRYIRAKKFNGLVTIELWNRANKGKFTIVETNNEVRVIEAGKDTKRQKKDKRNPFFPFKNVVRCPVTNCTKMLWGSSPKNGSAAHTRTYHHAWKHEHYGINADKFEEQIYKFLDNVEFEDKYGYALRQKILKFWEIKRSRLIDDSVNVADRLKENALNQQQLKVTIKQLREPRVIAMMENDLSMLLVEEEDLKQLHNKKQEEKIDVQLVINRVTYYLEHLGELIKNELDIEKKEILFSLIFEELPTVKDLYFGTARLACVFKLKEEFKKTIGLQNTVGDPVAFSFEHFMNWIENLRLAFFKNYNKITN